MRLNTYAAATHVLDKDVRDHTVLVVDTLRATSTMITACSNGCREIIPASEVDEALQVARTIGEHVLLGGERDTYIVPGFDLSNSPLEYTKETVKDKVLIMTTSNGTNAINRMRSAKHLLISALINDAASAREAVALGKNTTIVCAGTGGKASWDDLITAGAIITRILSLGGEWELDDLARMCKVIYEQHKDDIFGALKGTLHFEHLLQKGWEEDVRYCCQSGIIDVVPRYTDGMITA
ncbi:MAG: 2-phosphosulfolactate phosphatase [Christensenellales bacterium]|jgi:2-phosphosulfolactate phosphatase